MFVNWICGVILVYSILFGIGNLIFGYITEFIISLLLLVPAVFVIYRNLSKQGWGSIVK